MGNFLSPEICKEIAEKFTGLTSDMYYARFNRSWKLYSDIELDSMCNLLCEEPKEEFPAITFEAFQGYSIKKGFYGFLYPVQSNEIDPFTPLHVNWSWELHEISRRGADVTLIHSAGLYTGQNGMKSAKEGCVREILKMI